VEAGIETEPVTLFGDTDFGVEFEGGLTVVVVVVMVVAVIFGKEGVIGMITGFARRAFGANDDRVLLPLAERFGSEAERGREEAD